MDVGIRLLFFLIIAIFLFRTKETKDIQYFREQTWSVRDILPTYLLLSFLPLIGLYLYNVFPIKLYYLAVTHILTILAALILFLTIKKVIIHKRQLSYKVIGLKSYDIYIYLIVIFASYGMIIGIILANDKIHSYSGIFHTTLYAFTVIGLWPIIEDIFYIGIMLIPTSRTTGVTIGAVIVSLSRTLAHFHYGPKAILTNGILALLGCYLYIKLKRILAPVLLHSLVNSALLLRDLI